MEKIIEKIKEKIELFGLNPQNGESISDKDCYIGAFLLGFAEYLKNSKITSLQEIEQLQRTFNEDLVQKLIEEKIVPKNSVAITLEAITHKVRHLFQKSTSKKISEDLSIIQKELILIVQKLYILSDTAKNEIAKNFTKSINNDVKILIFGYSIEVIYSLIYARQKGKIFTVYIANSNKKDISDKMIEVLKKYEIDFHLISDISISLYLSKIDFILTGADAICENGGIINKVGTHVIAMCGNVYKKPFYVLVSSLRYLKMYVIESNHLELLNKKYSNNDEGIVDFTPPEFITLFFTDKGILTPNAICDEIIQLFYDL